MCLGPGDVPLTLVQYIVFIHDSRSQVFVTVEDIDVLIILKVSEIVSRELQCMSRLLVVCNHLGGII